MPQIAAQYRNELQDLVDKRLEGADEQLKWNELEKFKAFTIHKVCETKLNQLTGLNPSNSPCIDSIREMVLQCKYICFEFTFIKCCRNNKKPVRLKILPMERFWSSGYYAPSVFDKCLLKNLLKYLLNCLFLKLK